VVHRGDQLKDGRWWTLAAACLAVFALLVNVTIVAVALPEIGGSLDAGFTAQRWVVSGYALALATLILGAGSLADLFGHRRLFLIGLTLFLAASVACGAASSAALLVGARLAQGAAAAVLFSTSLALIGSAFPGRDRAKALGVWAITVGVAAGAGPLLGGALIELGSWRWIFLVNVPVVLVAVGVVLLRVRHGEAGVGDPVDWPGQACAAAALFLLLFAITEGADRGWGSTSIVAALCASAVLFALFVAVEMRVSHPMLDLSLLRRRGALGAALTGFVIHASFFSMWVFLAIYLQSVLGYSALVAGVALVPVAIANGLVGAFAGRVAAWASVAARVAVGLALICGGLLLLLDLDAHSSWTALLAGSIVGGVGIGIANPAIVGAALGAVEPARGGIASGLNVTFRQLGTAMGVAGFGTLLQAEAQARVGELLTAGGSAAHDAGDLAAVGSPDRAADMVSAGIRADVLEAGRVAFVDGLHLVLLVAAGLAALGVLIALTVMRGAREAGAAPEPAVEVAAPGRGSAEHRAAEGRQKVQPLP
jgi:EmrB/QacA subfamily drug resistance transporter